MSDQLTKHFSLTINGKEENVFMSFGLINTLTGYFENPNQIEEALLNPSVRSSLLIEAFSERHEDGRLKKTIDLSKADIDPEEAFEFFDWLASHIEDFFMKALRKANTRMKTKKLNT